MKNKIIILFIVSFFLLTSCDKTDKKNVDNASSKVIHLTDSNFAENIKDGFIIVDFWAEWCAPCRKIAPIFEELANEMDNVRFAKLNVDENKASASRYKVRSIPFLVIFRDGKQIDSILGLRDKTFIRNKIEEYSK